MAEKSVPRDLFLWAHDQKDVVWMSQNTNTIPMPDHMNGAIMEAVRTREYAQYPYAPGLPGLRELLMDDLGLTGSEPPFSTLLTNGAIEALYILNRALLRPGDEVISTDPTFVPIHKQIEMNGARPVAVPVYGSTWKLTPEQINENLGPKTKMILFIDPLNPLGSGYNRDEVRAVAEIAEDSKIWLVHDITYRDFAYEHTMASEFYPEGTLYAYSFSKNLGFAGMRIGALIAPAGLMDSTLRHYDTNVLSVNILAQVGARAALETKGEWMADMVAVARNNQNIIKEAVDRVPGAFIPVFPSSTNMLVIDIADTGVDPDDLQREMLLEDHVFIRSGGYVSAAFGHRFVRVSFTVPEEGARRFADSFVRRMGELGDGA